MTKHNRFGKAFRKVRLARGLTQEDFAEESGRTYVSELERDVKNPTLNKIDELAVPLSIHPLTVVALSYIVKDNLIEVDRLLAQVRAEIQEII